MWGRNSFDFAPSSSGPHPVTNSVRLRNGASDPRFRVGDFTNPILKPEAADVVRRRGELSRGGDFPDASNQCGPYTPPYSHAMGLQLEILQVKGQVLILYPQDQGVRHIRLNQRHPSAVTPSQYGDSVGRYEGDTLVVDTVGFKVGPLSMVDRYVTYAIQQDPPSGGTFPADRSRSREPGGGAAREGIRPCRRATGSCDHRS